MKISGLEQGVHRESRQKMHMERDPPVITSQHNRLAPRACSSGGELPLLRVTAVIKSL